MYVTIEDQGLLKGEAHASAQVYFCLYLCFHLCVYLYALCLSLCLCLCLCLFLCKLFRSSASGRFTSEISLGNLHIDSCHTYIFST